MTCGLRRRCTGFDKLLSLNLGRGGALVIVGGEEIDQVVCKASLRGLMKIQRSSSEKRKHERSQALPCALSNVLSR